LVGESSYANKDLLQGKHAEKIFERFALTNHMWPHGLLIKDARPAN
jgi:hypothetical protein